MTDPHVRRFLESAVDSLTKLQLVMLFAERTIRQGTAEEISLRAARDIWSVTEALEGLVRASVLSVQQSGGKRVYVYDPGPEQREQICLLMRAYNDPLERDGLQCFVRQLAPLPVMLPAAIEVTWTNLSMAYEAGR